MADSSEAILYDMAFDLLQAVVDELDCTSIGAPQCLQCDDSDCTEVLVVPEADPVGSPCCGSVLAWVSDVSFTSTTLGGFEEPAVNCADVLTAVATLNVRTRRCVTTPAGGCRDDDVVITGPNGEVLGPLRQLDAQLVAIDHWAVAKGIACFARSLSTRYGRRALWVPGDVVRSGDQGCVGVDGSLQVKVPSALCCCDEA